MLNELVKIKKEFLDCPKEAYCIFKVLEDNGDRLLIVWINSNLPIPPTEIVKKEWIQKI